MKKGGKIRDNEIISDSIGHEFAVISIEDQSGAKNYYVVRKIVYL